MKARMRSLFLAALMMVACGDDPAPDLRLMTPMTTIETLLDSYGVAELPQEEIDRRLSIGRRFHLNDPAALRACFSDWEEPAGEGLAGYVFGSIIVAKDDLIATVRDDEAEVMVRDAERRTRPVVLEREDGAWRINLERSVPRSVREEIETKAAERASEANPALENR